MKESNTPELKLPEDPLMDEVAQETKPASRKTGEAEAQETVQEEQPATEQATPGKAKIEVGKKKRPALSLEYLVTGAVVAALYAALTILLAPISYGTIQFRVAEALTVLPILTPSAIPGLTIGCLIANIVGGFGWMDIVFGTLATLIAALLTRVLRKFSWFATLMPVITNGLVVGGVLSATLKLPFWPTAATVALGEAAVCYMLGLPLVKLLKNNVKSK